MKIIAVIPARGGSKGIPKKNIQIIAGKPLIAWSILALKKSKKVDRIIISTDNKEIAGISKKYGSEVISRPDNISDDTASSESAIIHVLEFLQKTESYVPDIVLFVQCTSPLIITEDVNGIIDKMLNENADSAFTAIEFNHFLWEKDNTGLLKEINHNKENRLPRQKLNPTYLEVGLIYAFKTDIFLKKKFRFAGKQTVYLIPKIRSLEIDDYDDFSLAEVLLVRQKLRKDINLIPDKIEAIILDFDGIFTDNNVIIDQNGIESVVCNRSDGMGIAKLKGLIKNIIVLSTEKNEVLLRRTEKLGLKTFYGIDNKKDFLIEYLRKNNINIDNVIYLGNDINDQACMEIVGCSIAVSDANEKILNIADIVLNKKGGKGALRELFEIINHREGV